VALYIAAVMWVSIVVTAVVLDVLFSRLGITPGGGRAVHDVGRFAVDHTFWLNLAMIAATVAWAVTG